MKAFSFIRGGFNTDREHGTYCCFELRTKVIGHSNVAKAFGRDTESSAIDSAISNLRGIINELEEKKTKL